MKAWQIVAVVVAVTVVAATVFTASAYAMMGGFYSGSNTLGNYDYYNGMMGGGYGYGGGMMGGYAYNQQGTGCGVHGQITGYSTDGVSSITIQTAQAEAQNYVASLNNPDLFVAEVEEYQYNFYAQVIEKSTGNGAFELLIDKNTGGIYPEMGPNMMWNNKYGTQTGGMMGGGGMMSGYNYNTTPTTTMPVGTTQANSNAQQYLSANYPGATTGDVTTFYGYYTIEVLDEAAPYEMLSVNGYTGQVWYHTWHGVFIQEI